MLLNALIQPVKKIRRKNNPLKRTRNKKPMCIVHSFRVNGCKFLQDGDFFFSLQIFPRGVLENCVWGGVGLLEGCIIYNIPTP